MYLFDIRHQRNRLLALLTLTISGVLLFHLLFFENNIKSSWKIVGMILLFSLLCSPIVSWGFSLPIFLVDYDPTQCEFDENLELCACNYSNYGLYHTWTLSLTKLAKKTQKEQMLYSDAITRRYSLNKAFLLSQKNRDFNEIMDRIDEFNGCAIGNYAFMAHYNPGTVFETRYKEVIEYFSKKS